MLNKKWMVYGILAIMIATVLFPKVMAIGNNPTLTIGEKTAYSGDTINLPITLQYADEVTAVEYVVTYDQNALTLNTVDNGGIFSVCNPVIGAGSVSITQSGASGGANGVIVTLSFTVNPSAAAEVYEIGAESEVYNGQSAMGSTIRGNVEVLGVYFDDFIEKLFALDATSRDSLADLMVLGKNMNDISGVENTIGTLVNVLGKDAIYDEIMSSIWEIADLYDGSASALATAVNNDNVQSFKDSFSAEDIAIISNNPFGLDALDVRIPKLDLLLNYLHQAKENGDIGGVSSVVLDLEQNVLSVSALEDIYDVIVLLGGEIKTFPGIEEFEAGLNQLVTYYNDEASFSDQQYLVDFLEDHQLINNNTVYFDDLMARLFALDAASRDSLADLMVLGYNIDDTNGIQSAINTLLGIFGKDGAYDEDINAIWELPTYYNGTAAQLRADVLAGDMDAFMAKFSSEDIETIGYYSFGYQAFEARVPKLDMVLSWLNTAKETGELFGKSTFAFNLSQSQLTVRDISAIYASMAEDLGVSLIIPTLPALTSIEDGLQELATHYNSTTAGDQLQILNFLTGHQMVYRDTTPPVITLEGSAEVTVEVNTSYNDAGATASDAADGDLTAVINVDNPVDISAVASYTITYTVTDSDNNTATITRTVNVVDTTAPVITLTDGTVTIEVEANLQAPTTWADEDPGYAASDNGDDSVEVDVDTSNLDLTAIGTYTISYDAEDEAGNVATTVTRTVKVVDTVAPVLNLGDSPSLMTIEKDGDFEDPGCTAVDAYDGTVSVTTTGSVNTAVPGTYTLTYTAKDASNNIATATRTVVVDPGKPFIVLSGDDMVTIEVDKDAGVYVDPGATGYFNGTSVAIQPVQNTVDLTQVGTYTLAFAYSAEGRDADNVYRTVRVEDTTAPIITLTGESLIELAVGDNYVELNATATDNYDADINVVIEGSVNTAKSGIYTLTYKAYDSNGNAAIPVVRTVTVKDTNAPVITLTGLADITISVGTAYTDAGATALDQEDGNITAQIVTVNPVDTDIVGDYLITYNVSDSSENAANEVTRTIHVEDNISPTITLYGDNPVTLEAGSSATYSDANGRVDDNYDTMLTWSDVLVTGAVNAQVPGSYTLTYTVEDEAGNQASKQRTVNVVDTTAPVLALAGDNPMNIEAGSVTSYSEPLGSSVSDNVDTIAWNRVTKSGSVNVRVPGTYTITYTVNDNSNNTGTATRTVNVTDTTSPVITLLGNAQIEIALGSTYTDAGATANDNVDGDLTAEIITNNPVDTSVPAVYTVTYTVYDSASLEQTATRTVTVSDQTAPVITLSGGTEVEVNFGEDFMEPGGSVSDNYDNLTWQDVVITGTELVDTSVPGDYVLTYAVEDSAHNEAFVERIVTVIDNVKPVITVSNTEITLAQDAEGTYTNTVALEGVSAEDNVDGDITGRIQVINPVDVTQVGDYIVRYNVYDNAGNSALQQTQTVHVTDQTAPVITLNGSSSISIPVGAEYVDPGATATDNVDEAVTVTNNSVTVVDTAVSDTYIVTYTAIDAAENTATLERTVIVNAALNDPVLLLKGASVITIAQGSTYTDAGYQLFHPTPGMWTVDPESTVDTTTVGMYTVTYSITGKTSVTRTVHVTDQTAPVITLNGDEVIIVPCEAVYNELGAVVSDNHDADRTIQANVSHIDTDMLGVYTVVYEASDAAGNQAEPVTRTVIVAIPGDARANYELTVADAAKIRQYIAQGQMDAVQLFTSDFNGDGVVNNADILAILEYIVGLEYVG